MIVVWSLLAWCEHSKGKPLAHEITLSPLECKGFDVSRIEFASPGDKQCSSTRPHRCNAYVYPKKR